MTQAKNGFRLGPAFNRAWKIGRTKAPVLPERGGEMAYTSFPSRARGMTCA